MTEVVNDLYLIEQVRKGDKSAFKGLVEKYEKPISNVVIGLLGDTPEAEEVAQEVFLKFYFNIESFRSDSTLRTYLTRIAINLSLNELKKRKKNRERFVFEQDIKYQAGISEENNYELKELVEKVLQTLNPSLRSVVVLRLIEGYDTRETAKILKIPTGTVLSRLSRAQEKLRPVLKKYL